MLVGNGQTILNDVSKPACLQKYKDRISIRPNYFYRCVSDIVHQLTVGSIDHFYLPFFKIQKWEDSRTLQFRASIKGLQGSNVKNQVQFCLKQDEIFQQQQFNILNYVEGNYKKQIELIFLSNCILTKLFLQKYQIVTALLYIFKFSTGWVCLIFEMHCSVVRNFNFTVSLLQRVQLCAKQFQLWKLVCVHTVW